MLWKFGFIANFTNDKWQELTTATVTYVVVVVAVVGLFHQYYNL